MTVYKKYITIHPDQRSGHRGDGQPCIRGRRGNGMRITVYDVLSYLAAGDSIEEILENFPMLTKEDVLACLAFAADAEKRFKLLNRL
jgi:uncharacterized protein (DUF433 family)